MDRNDTKADDSRNKKRHVGAQEVCDDHGKPDHAREDAAQDGQKLEADARRHYALACVSGKSRHVVLGVPMRPVDIWVLDEARVTIGAYGLVLEARHLWHRHQKRARDVRRGLLSREEGEYLLSFVNNTGPAFLVGGIGLTLFGSVKLGWALYLLQIPVALIVGLLFRPAAPFVPHAAPTDEIRFTDPVAATARAAETCVRIAGFICFFSVLSSLLSVFLPGGLPLALASSVLEVGCGASLAAGLRFPFPAVPLVALTVCFSGCSVHFQTISAIAGTGMKTDRYWKGKTVSGALGFTLSLLLCLTN